MAETGHRAHVWRFFRAGGVDQVRIDAGADAAAIGALDQKLWVALACPTRGIEFDPRTLDLIDSDKDGRIRAPEIMAAVAWATPLLKSPETLARGGDRLVLDAIDDAVPLGHAIRASAAAILQRLGKAGTAEIELQDALDVEHIYDGTPFNGDGIVTLAAAEDEDTRGILADIMTCVGSETDRSRQPGVSQALVDRFFAEAASLVAWRAEAEEAPQALLPLGDATDRAATLLDALGAKIDDWFTRARLAAFDPSAGAALNPPLEAYEAMAREMLAPDAAALAALPLARIGAGTNLPLETGLNPAWEAPVAAFRDTVVTPLLGARDALGEADWAAIVERFRPHAAWRARQPETTLASLPPDRLKALVDPAVKARIDALIARDLALEPEMNAISQVEKLLRFKRDLMALLNNFVSFKDFYTRAGKASFQAGTLYLDGRSCELCVKVEDEAKHAVLAQLSRIYLAYCRCVRDGGKETMTIAAAFTAGDSDNLLVGRNGVFYDRKGGDWDATVVKIVEHPISLRQSFWLPYRQFARLLAEQVQKFAAARSAASQSQMAQTVARVETATLGPAQAPPAAAAAPQPAPFDAARFAGIFAALGLAVGALGTAIASLVTGFLQLAWWQIPLALAGIVLLISGPSCLIAAIKLQGRNLGPLLDASGWAVNARLKINLPFGRTLTGMAALPERAERSLTDPYAERRQPWALYVAALVLIAAGIVAWRMWGPHLPLRW